jgi:Uma2 family endonuclease
MVVRARMNVAQFEATAHELGPCELERGEVTFLSPAGFFHNNVATNIAVILSAWARKSKRGRVVTNETGIVIDETPGTVRGADVLYISYSRLPRSQSPAGFLRVAPELVIEIVGPKQSWKRVLQKTAEYFELGVERVWLVDPRKKRVHVYAPNAEPRVFETRSMITDEEQLPGFRCRVAEFFAE